MPTRRLKPRGRNTRRIDFRTGVLLPTPTPSTKSMMHRTLSYANEKRKQFHKWNNRNPRKVALMIVTASGLFLINKQHQCSKVPSLSYQYQNQFAPNWKRCLKS